MIRAHFAYFRYVFRHKWFVFFECCRLGIPWLGVVHDWHKFTPSEWFPYVHFFYNRDGSKKPVRFKGYYKAGATGDERFDYAWFLHQKRSYHHWQSWAFPDPDGNLKLVPMSSRHGKEMLADWRGAARAQGKDRNSITEWYQANGVKLRLHPETRQWIEDQLGLT